MRYLPVEAECACCIRPLVRSSHSPKNLFRYFALGIDTTPSTFWQSRETGQDNGFLADREPHFPKRRTLPAPEVAEEARCLHREVEAKRLTEAFSVRRQGAPGSLVLPELPEQP